MILRAALTQPALKLKAGDLAFFDAHEAGPIPCKVVSIKGTSGPAGSMQDVTFKLTATRGAWKAGEQLTRWGLHVLPRKALRGNRILPYWVEAAGDQR
jgi:hypothetical protein